MKLFGNLILWGMAGIVALAILAGCAGAGSSDVESRLSDASAAVAEENWAQAQKLCDGIFALLGTPDSSAVSESQAGELAILYMKLSEHRNEDENIAEATQTFRYAWRLSSDSLRGFSQSLPLEDQRHFVLLRRISLSIDNPVDLMDLDFSEEDSMHADSLNADGHI